MSPDSPDGLAYRVSALEREVSGLKAGKPDVVAERVHRLSTDVHEIRRDVNVEIGDLAAKVDALRRTFIGLLVTIAGACILIVITQILLAGPAR